MHIVDTLFAAAHREEADRIFVVGDFGYWPRRKDGKFFLEELEKCAKAHDLMIYFLDGNHEDHWALRELLNKKDIEGFYIVSDHIRYAPRGHRWNWFGVRFLALGGAYSIDRNWRVIGESFFWEEVLDDDDVKNAGTDEVDIMLTHDIPAGIDMQTLMTIRGREFSIINESYRNTMRVREVVDKVNPLLLFHGHYHINYSQKLDNDLTTVVGLSCDGSGKDSYQVIDLSLWGADTR